MEEIGKLSKEFTTLQHALAKKQNRQQEEVNHPNKNQHLTEVIFVDHEAPVLIPKLGHFVFVLVHID